MFSARRMLAAAAVSAAALAMLTAPPSSATQGGVVSGTVSSTMQTNGTVWHLAYANGAIYALGDFTTVRPSGAAAGTSQTGRQYMAAFNSSTGALLPFSHTFSSRPTTVAASPDGSRLYVGGSFTTVDGVAVGRIVAFDTATGNIVSSFAPKPAGGVTAIGATNSTVYFSGNFTQVGSTSRQRLAAAAASNGALTAWAPTLDVSAFTMAVTSDGARVFLGGGFNTLNGSPQRAVGEVNGGSGATSSFAAASAMPAKTSSCISTVRDSVISGDSVYFAAEGTGGGCFDGTFAASVSSGSLRWQNTCLGATQSVEVVGSYLYKGSHAHDCQRLNSYHDPDAFPQVATGQGRHLLAENTSNGFLGPWYPQTNGGSNGAGLGPRDMATDGSNLWVAGEFTSVNNKPQQGLARFATTPDTAPARPVAPSASAAGGSSVNVSATVPLDIDDTDLILRLYRDGGSTPVATSTVQHSLFWRQPVVVFRDAGLVNGSSHTYRVDAKESNANVASPLSAASASVTVR